MSFPCETAYSLIWYLKICGIPPVWSVHGAITTPYDVIIHGVKLARLPLVIMLKNKSTGGTSGLHRAA